MERQLGFTLVETLVTIVIFGFVMIACADLLRGMYENSTMDPNSLNTTDRARSVLSTFANELRDASVGSSGAYPITEASTTEIVFFSPYGSGSASVVNRIRYYLSGSTLYKGVTAPSGSPATYNLANEKVTPVASSIVSTSSIFSYYDGSYAGTSSPLAQPVNINDVSYVQLSFPILVQDARGATSSFILSTGAAIRNLKTNLGN